MLASLVVRKHREGLTKEQVSPVLQRINYCASLLFCLMVIELSVVELLGRVLSWAPLAVLMLLHECCSHTRVGGISLFAYGQVLAKEAQDRRQC